MTASRPETTLPVDVQGEIRLEGPTARALTLTADGSQLSLAAPGWESLHGLGPRSLLAQRRLLRNAIGALRKMNLTLDLNVGGRRAFGLGDGIRTTLVARLLGLPSADLRISDVISLLRSRAAARHSGPR